MNESEILPGDILAMRGASFLSRGILRATGNTVSHIGIVTAISPFIEITEALVRVKTRPMSITLEDGIAAAFILQDRTLIIDERIKIVERALGFSAAGYNYPDLLLQLLNSIFRTTWFTDYLTINMNHYPICSYVAAKSYAETGRGFGMSDRTTSPADIYAWAINHSDKYRILQIK